jgi:hypothetical protein
MLRLMPLRRTTLRIAALVSVGVLCVGCTSNDSNTAPDTAPGTPTSEAVTTTATAPQITLTRPNAPFVVRIAQMGGGLRRSDRHRLQAAIGAPVRAWFDGGFLTPAYPTSEFPDAFGSWTKDGSEQATHDRDITTNATFGPDLVALVADKRKAKLYVFAEHGIAGGATARVRLALTGERQDGSLVRYAVSGEVYLTRDKRSWRIFGYDLHRTKEAS